MIIIIIILDYTFFEDFVHQHYPISILE